MKNQYQECIKRLNDDSISVRLENLRLLMEGVKKGEIESPVREKDVNNHIHTNYSFSPYSPTKAIWMAYTAGLTTAGIMDHDSIAGAREFIEAGRIAGMATTIGLECRVDFSATPLSGKRINNPDQKSIVYMALHGIPHTCIDAVSDFFAPYREYRSQRNIRMVDRINETMKPFNIMLDYEEDVIPISKYREGGSITERHILFALSRQLIVRYGRGENLIQFLKDSLHLPISGKIEEYLMDVENAYYEYDLLGVLKSDLVEKIYIDATLECPDVQEIIAFSREIGAIPAYAYLGDVGESVTGDKKSQKFEDSYLELMFEVIKDLGFKAVTYMPSRNSLDQLERVKALCEKFEFFQISGEDINSPRQSFICQAMRNPAFHKLIESTWALIGHEIAATEDINQGMFAPKSEITLVKLDRKIKAYAELGRKSIKNKRPI